MESSTISSCKLLSLSLDSGRSCTPTNQTPKLVPHRHLRISNSKVDANNPFLLQNQRLGLFSAGIKPLIQNDCGRNLYLIVNCNAQGPSAPSDPSGSSAGSWRFWLLGTIISIIIPFWKNKWGPLAPLLELKEKFDTAIDVAEQVAEVVEDVAEKVDKVAEEAADNLPKGELQNIARFIEKAAEEIDKDAERAGQVLDKLPPTPRNNLSSSLSFTQSLDSQGSVGRREANSHYLASHNRLSSSFPRATGIADTVSPRNDFFSFSSDMAGDCVKEGGRKLAR